MIGFSIFSPVEGLGKDVVNWLGHSISEGIGGFSSWAIGGVIHAMASTTTPDFTTWFAGPWRAMLAVVVWLSIPILFVGVGTAALRGDLTSVLKRGLGAPVLMAVGTAVAVPVTAGVLTLVNGCCGLLVDVAIGGNQGFGQGLSHLSDFALSATVASGGSGLPGLAAALIVALAGLAALAIWFVLALRGALLYLEVLAVPLALCGLYWGGTAHWIKKLIDLIVATILSQLVITMLMVLAAADLNKNQLALNGSVGGGHDDAVLGRGVPRARIVGPADGTAPCSRCHRARGRSSIPDQRPGSDDVHGEPDRRHGQDDGRIGRRHPGDRPPSRGCSRAPRCGGVRRCRCRHLCRSERRRRRHWRRQRRGRRGARTRSGDGHHRAIGIWPRRRGVTEFERGSRERCDQAGGRQPPGPYRWSFATAGAAWPSAGGPGGRGCRAARCGRSLSWLNPRCSTTSVS